MAENPKFILNKTNELLKIIKEHAEMHTYLLASIDNKIGGGGGGTPTQPPAEVPYTFPPAYNTPVVKKSQAPQVI